MLKFGMFHFRRSKNVDDINYVCQVEFLDDSEPLSITYQKNTKGQYLLDHVCNTLDLVETDYFGLRYLNQERQQSWIDASRSIHKQLKGLASPLLSFRVKFYPSDPTKLKEEITRYQIFLQVKKDFFMNVLQCPDEDTNQLAAYIVQSELGDYDDQEHVLNYVSEVKCLPKQSSVKAEAVSTIHKTLAGQVPAEAEANFLKKASDLDSYGVEPHFVTDVRGTNLLLGVTFRGVLTFYNNICTHVFKWTQICRFEFDGKLFIIRLASFDNDESSLLATKTLPSPDSCGCGVSKKPTVTFRCLTTGDCKHLWKSAIEQKYFFTLKCALEAPRFVSSGGLFHRGSKFRFSGRCEQEVYTSQMDINRKEPSFTRSSSNAQFVQKYSSLRSSTLPSKWRPRGSVDSSDRGVAIETSLNDSFQSSCGAMKDEVVSNVIVDDDHEQLVVAEVVDPTKTVVDVDVMRENSPPTDDEGSEPEGSETEDVSLVSANSISTVKIASCPPDVFEWSNEATSFSPMSFVTQSEPNICSEDLPQTNSVSAENIVSESVESVENEGEPQEPEPFEVLETLQAAVDELPQEEQLSIVTSAVVSKRRMWRPSVIVKVLFASIALFVILIILALETQLDYPIISDLRNMPEVHQLAAEYYHPLRQVVIEQYNGLMGP